MHSRSSLVNWMNILSVDSSGTVQIGDSNQITPETNIFALQREQANFRGNEYEDLSPFSIYSQALPLPLLTECINHITVHENPVIKVNSIQVLGVAASGVVHVGSTRTIQAEARVKNIREFFSDPNEGNE
ncbi:spore germination protein GerPE [Alkalihalobacillus macyae]|uniref:spore germination protein GerPE n=1 Tax=Guptibacillus hwajinpoensis TaxID=208199 RepID=UPI00273ADA61|nr:spore germination protein GerPE [Alkalihalobacillus macyae]MDP4550689.1 spore germination protein GerPE [Alkalihalobacillus macyae]